jgi:hypothetical protein
MTDPAVDADPSTVAAPGANTVIVTDAVTDADSADLDVEPTPSTPSAPATPFTPSASAGDRRALLDLLIYAWDRAKSPGVQERLTAGLEPMGITVLRPDGEPFDPTRHEAGGVEPTTDDALVGTIAETELVGFADRGIVVREPVVVVYRRG